PRCACCSRPWWCAVAKPLNGGIAKMVAKALNASKMTKPATLTKLTPGTRTTASGGTNPTSVDYACRGFVEDYGPGLIDGTLITAQDRKVSLIGATIRGAVPEPNDHVTIEGATYVIQRVTRDPAAAMYTCQGRGASS